MGCTQPRSAAPPLGTNSTVLAAETPPVEPLPTTRTSRHVADLADARINESSGLARSRRFPDFYWTHNDSGDTARAFLIDRSGATRCVINLKGASATDWEDCAVATVNGRNWLYLADIGDNAEKRASVTIFRVDETAITEGVAEQEVPCEAQELIYPDGAHDAETLIAAPDGRLMIVTKKSGSGSIFVTPKPFDAGTKQTLKKIGALEFEGVSVFGRLTTGGDLSPDGKRLVIRTYTHAYEWELKGEAFDSGWWQRAPHKFVLPSQRQGEAIAYAADSFTLLTTSEKLPAPLDETSPNETAPTDSVVKQSPAQTPPEAK